jgi:hypothetical protein
VFSILVDSRGDDLRNFVVWLLAEARDSAQYFEAGYRFTSFII